MNRIPGERVAGPPLAGHGRRRGGWLASAAAAILLLAGCYTLPAPAELSWMRISPAPRLEAHTPRATRNLQVFDWVWRTIDVNYYDPKFHGVDWAAARTRFRPAAAAAKDDAQLYRTINAMLGELHDAHTRALSPRAVARKRERRQVWIGLDYAPLEGSPEAVVIIRVWPDSAAARAGVAPGWILQTCDGRGARSFLLKDPRLADGQRLTCTFLDDRGRPRTRELTAYPLERPPQLQARRLPDGVVYLRFDGFTAKDARWLYREIGMHDAAPGMILDLRYNPGGQSVYLEFIAGLFLPRGQLLGRYDRRGQEPVAVNSRRPLFAPRYRGRLAILVSHATASAAEILTRALQKDRNAVVVGQKTAGRVLNAYQTALPDGGRLSFSIRDFRTPDGRHLEGVGVEPEVAVNYSLGEIRAGIDPAVNSALRALLDPAARLNS